MISSARALSRLFSSWPFDEDSFLSTSCEICYKFPFVMQCKTWFKQNMQIEIPDESPRKLQHSAEGLSDYDTFRSSAQVPLTSLLAISRVIFNILNFFSRQIKRYSLLLTVTKEQKTKFLKFWPDFVDSNLNVSTSLNSKWKDVIELTTFCATLCSRMYEERIPERRWDEISYFKFFSRLKIR